MAESRQAWDEVSESFAALGRRVKQHYEQRGDQGDAADRKAAEDALRRLADSLDQTFTAVGNAVRDPAFGEETRKAASKLGEALSATFAEMSDDLRERFKSRGRGPGGPATP
ncbi:MAG TPA: hypothetical protein VEP73_07505 [Actinomycetota bacterium]|nr:hypothetical protein [Actinomycetota bacterium]